MKRNIDEILADYLNKEPLTEDEKQVFEDWKLSSRDEKFGRMIQKLECQKKILDKHEKQNAVFAKTKRHVHRERRKRQYIRWSSYAAGIILLIGSFFILQRGLQDKTAPSQRYIAISTSTPTAVELILPDGSKHILDTKEKTVIISDSIGEMRTNEKTLIVETNETEAREPKYYTINVPLGGEYNIILSDGTKIYLNAGSTLRYPDQFTSSKREIFLEGEGYFKVTPDSLCPFMVHAAEMTLRVLGTSFNVKAYPEEKWVKTTLVTGRVEALYGDKKIVMTPGTQVAYNKTTGNANQFPVEVKHFISWKDGFYDFEEMPLEELMQILARWYNLQIEFADPELKTLKFSGRLKRYTHIESLFDMLEYTRDVKFTIEDRHIVIQKK